MKPIRIKENTFFIENIYRITDIDGDKSYHYFFINDIRISEYDGWNWYDLINYNDKKGYKKLKRDSEFTEKRKVQNNNIFFNTTSIIEEIDAEAYWKYLKDQPVYKEFEKLKKNSGLKKLNRIRNKVFKLCKECNKVNDDKKMESIRQIVFIAIGEGSMCWHKTPKGLFDVVAAAKAGTDAMKKIKEVLNG